MKPKHLLSLLASFLFLLSCAAVTEPMGVEDPFAIPRAFEDVPRNQAMLNPALSVTTMVVELPKGMNAELGPDLQSKVIRALEDSDIAAQMSSGLPSWTLKARQAGTFRAEPASLPTSVIVWRVYDKNNVKKGQFTSTFTGTNAADVIPRLSEQAAFVSKQVLALLAADGDPTAAATQGGSEAQDNFVLTVGSISGAPGDGNRALAQSLKTALAAKGARVSDTLPDGGWQVECAVTVSSLSATEDRVQLVWKLLDPSKKEAGTLTQENPVPKGRLAKKWGEVATFASEAAADGIWQIIQQIRASKDK